MKRYLKYGLVCVALLGILLVGNVWRPAILRSAPQEPQAEVENAWQQALELGQYRYNTTVVQTTWHTARLENAGLSSKQAPLYVEGEINRPQDIMQLKLWSSGGGVASGARAVEIKVERGQAFGRVDAGDWQPIDKFTDLFAPNNDPLAYLAAAQNIEKIGAEDHRVGEAVVQTTHYRFEVIGLKFAEYMRDQIQTELVRRGELPAGVEMDTIRQYVDMRGAGDLWLGADGLPLRQMVRIQFPPEKGAMEWTEAEITTDFVHGQPARSLQPGVAGAIGWLQHKAERTLTPELCGQMLLAVALNGLVLLLITARRSRLMYGAVVSVVIVSMVVTPLLQSNQVYAFTQKQLAAQAEREQEKRDREADEKLLAMWNTARFDPHTSPVQQATPVPPAPVEALAPAANSAPPPRADTDGPAFSIAGPDADIDGLSAAQEARLGTSDASPDSDGDGLSDQVELVELGTNPALADSDGDRLSDGQEARGFTDAAGKRWYTDPQAADSNKDGLTDLQECSAIVTGGSACKDTDGDKTPDVWDFDNDNDGVPDALDSAPNTVVGGGRDWYTGVKPLANQTLDFQVNSYTPGKPLFVDFTLRPANPKRLWYTLNVLDWPADDREGQVQRVFADTFGASGKEANGDLKLVPMLEVEIPYQEGHYGNLPVKPGAPATRKSLPALVTDETYTNTAKLNAWLTSWLDQATLDAMGISVRVKDEKGTLLVNVPLNLVQDILRTAEFWTFTHTIVRDEKSDFQLCVVYHGAVWVSS